MHLDFLIIGQGIAGSLLAEELLKRGKKICVVDDNHEASSSMVAAGLYNPVVFKRFAKSWRVDELLPFASATYAQFEKKLNANFHYKKNIVKIFASDDEFRLWEKRRIENKYMLPLLKCNLTLNEAIHAPYGWGEISQSGHVDLRLFLQLYRQYLIREKLLANEKIDYNEVKIEADGVSWKGIRSKKIIFCEGSKAVNNPFLAGCLLNLQRENY